MQKIAAIIADLISDGDFLSVGKALLKAASQKIISADSAKFDKASFVKFADINEADIIVTDSEPSETWLRFFQTKGVSAPNA